MRAWSQRLFLAFTLLALTVPALAQSVNFEAVRVNRVVRDQVDGYEVESRLTVAQANGKQFALCVVFYNGQGQPLKDQDGLYKSTDGSVASHVTFVANSDYCLVDSRENSSLGIFIPATQFHLAASEPLRAQMSLVTVPDSTSIGLSNLATFTFSP